MIESRKFRDMATNIQRLIWGVSVLYCLLSVLIIQWSHENAWNTVNAKSSIVSIVLFALSGILYGTLVVSTRFYTTYSARIQLAGENIIPILWILSLGIALGIESNNDNLVALLLAFLPALCSRSFRDVHSITISILWVLCLLFIIVFYHHSAMYCSLFGCLSLLSILPKATQWKGHRIDDNQPVNPFKHDGFSGFPHGTTTRVREAEENNTKHLLANVSHDLRTPLSALVTGGEALKSSLYKLRQLLATKDTTAACEELQSIEEDFGALRNTCAIMNMMINRYTDFCKISSGISIVPNIVSFDVMECVDTCVSCIRSLHKDVNLKVDSSLTSLGNVFCLCDRDWITESLLCILVNAIKFSGGNLPITLRVSLEDEECDTTDNDSDCGAKAKRFVRVEIEDEGVGVDDAHKDALFTSYRANQQLTGGTSIALYILAERMKRLQGKYGARDPAKLASDSQQSSKHGGDEKKRRKSALEMRGRGLVVWFAFPFVSVLRPHHTANDASDNSHASGNDNSNGNAPPSLKPPSISIPQFSIPLVGDGNTTPMHLRGQYRVLVVDDSLPILKMTAKMLEKDGHTVKEAVNGQMAVDMWLEEHFDVILMDIQMPILDGIQATKLIRQREQEAREARSLVRTSSDATLLTEPMFGSKRDELRPAGEDLHTPKLHCAVCENSNPHSPPPQQPSDTRLHSMIHQRQLIIGCSANSDYVTLTEAVAAGMDHFIPKPVTLKKMKEAIQKYCDTFSKQQ